MRLFEISKTETKVKTREMPSEEDIFTRSKFNAPEKAKAKPSLGLRSASAEKTRRTAAQAEISPEALGKLSAIHRLDVKDEISDEDAARRAGFNPDADYVEPKPLHHARTLVVPEKIPAVINKHIAEKDPIQPEWHQVKHLPGYLKTPIRAIGRQLFSVFTKTPVEDIQVLAHLKGSGPNSKQELNAVAGWLHNNGHRNSEAVANFEKSIPDYSAEMASYKVDGITFLVVQDFAGHYIYSWPSSDDHISKGAERKVGLDKKKLR